MSVHEALATLHQPWRTQYERDRAADRVEAEIARLREERDAAREHSREASEMYVQANEQITELLQQQSFMERKLAAQREDIERLATRVEAAEAERDAAGRIVRDLEEQRDDAQEELQIAEARCARLQDDVRSLVEERDAALSEVRLLMADYEECATARDMARQECARLERELEISETDGAWRQDTAAMRDRALAAEARCAQLQQALRRELELLGMAVALFAPHGGDSSRTGDYYAAAQIMESVRRLEALAGLDTPADSYVRCDKEIGTTGYYCGRPQGHEDKCYPMPLPADSQGSGTDPRGKERPRSSEWGEGANRSHMPSPADSQPEDEWVPVFEKVEPHALCCRECRERVAADSQSAERPTEVEEND